ncbi:MAG: hypothetical protein U1E69_13530 [Tabrizicola sp.]|uniref:hypothetical protein n=1 Tax=Tabrizicola sp. TaxID=2005166 RepID=UPI002AB8AF53|nr:hypothetical protein [Tabrizicola sp.]MDZ4087809.1 hypothetical protein [Tabrizicola sp.]
MVATVILHVGPYKTGTTALQKAFSANVDLLARHGILYPRTGRTRDSHAILAEALFRGDPSGLADLARESEGWRTVLISCEHLSALNQDGLTALRGAFPQAAFRVAYALRRLVRLWPSHWAELVKHGQVLSFPGYLDRVAQRDDRPFFAPILPARQLDRLADVFGVSALHLSLYDQAQAESLDLGPAFIDDLLGLGQIAPAFATRRANPSPSGLETALVYLLGRHAGPRTNHPTKRVARALLLDLLRHDPPPWRQPLQDALAQTDRIAFDNTHPLVTLEQAALAARYATQVPEGVKAYLQADRTEVPDLEKLRLDPDPSRLLARTFDSLMSAVQPDWTPPG